MLAACCVITLAPLLKAAASANTTVKTIPVPCSFRPEASSGA
jgi:hypothetical protein